MSGVDCCKCYRKEKVKEEPKAYRSFLWYTFQLISFLLIFPPFGGYSMTDEITKGRSPFT